MKRRPERSYAKKLVFAIAAFCMGTNGYAQQAGDFGVAYGYSAGSQARTVAPTPSSMAGTAIFNVSLPANFGLAGSTQTFTSTKTPGSSRTWGYGVTKLEVFHDSQLWKPETNDNRSLDFKADYTITLPTNGNETPGVEHYSHQILAMLNYAPSAQNSFEIDAGDLLGPRAAEPGFKQTPLLSLVGQHNLRTNGKGTNLDFEIDASPSTEGAPASAILTAGADHTFKSNVTLTALALVGLTANDPAFGISLGIKFAGHFGSKKAVSDALTFSRIQRLQTVRFFGKIGRF